MFVFILFIVTSTYSFILKIILNKKNNSIEFIKETSSTKEKIICKRKNNYNLSLLKSFVHIRFS